MGMQALTVTDLDKTLVLGAIPTSSDGNTYNKSNLWVRKLSRYVPNCQYVVVYTGELKIKQHVKNVISNFQKIKDSVSKNVTLIDKNDSTGIRKARNLNTNLTQALINRRQFHHTKKLEMDLNALKSTLPYIIASDQTVNGKNLKVRRDH